MKKKTIYSDAPADVDAALEAAVRIKDHLRPSLAQAKTGARIKTKRPCRKKAKSIKSPPPKIHFKYKKSAAKTKRGAQTSHNSKSITWPV